MEAQDGCWCHADISGAQEHCTAGHAGSAADFNALTQSIDLLDLTVAVADAAAWIAVDNDCRPWDF